MKVDVDELIKWLESRIESINNDLKMSEECKREGRTPPFADDNENWEICIKGRKEGFEDVKAHLICGKLNKAFHLCKAIYDTIDV